MGGGRATKGEVEKRIATVLGWMLDRHTRRRIVQSGSTLWGVSRRQVDNYISRAKDQIIRASKWKRDRALGMALMTLDRLMQRAIEADADDRALAVLKEGNKLLGLYEPSRIALETGPSVDLMENKTEDELAQIIRMYEAAARGGAEVGTPDGSNGPH